MDQSDELALSTFEGIDGATAGNYRAVISWYGASFPLTFDVMCGNGMVGPVNTGRMRQEPAWNYTSTSTMGLWSSAYCVLWLTSIWYEFTPNPTDISRKKVLPE